MVSVKHIDWTSVTASMQQRPWEPDEGEGMIRYVWLGTSYALTPSRTVDMVTDARWWEELNAAAEQHGYSLDVAADDIYVAEYYAHNKEDSQ